VICVTYTDKMWTAATLCLPYLLGEDIGTIFGRQAVGIAVMVFVLYWIMTYNVIYVSDELQFCIAFVTNYKK